jgi:hypothetical protein
MTRTRSHDQAFVEALPGDVYAVLAETGSYPRWWAGASTSGEALLLPLGRGAQAKAERERNGTGLHLVFGEESLEWYLEPFDDGTIVNAFLDVRGTERRTRRRLLRMRRSLHAGLVGLKRLLEARP